MLVGVNWHKLVTSFTQEFPEPNYDFCEDLHICTIDLCLSYKLGRQTRNLWKKKLHQDETSFMHKLTDSQKKQLHILLQTFLYVHLTLNEIT